MATKRPERFIQNLPSSVKEGCCQPVVMKLLRGSQAGTHTNREPSGEIKSSGRLADLDRMREIALSVGFGSPGLLLGLALGLTIRRWSVLALIAVIAALAVRYGVQRFGNGPGDNDPRIIWVVALVANLIGFLVGTTAGRLLAGRAKQVG
jgi:hypothetical protein